ncbi:sperm-associated antigen 5 [Taeniopygia guttata]|uniref:sperm-associated antigen 5 n=1 Tax=Taeniopygia guttata TaxID=59729 RepID=UPI003BB8E881
MQRNKTPVAQKRPRRTPLQQLQLGTDRTGLTPLFRRLRLKDNDCATPVSCARGPRSSVTTAPCTPGSPRSATLGPSSSTTLVPDILEPSSRTSTCDLRTPILKPGASEAPSNATLIPGALEPSSSTVPAPVCSSISVPSTPEPSSRAVPVSLCSPIPVPSTPEPSSRTVPDSLCSSSIPVPSTPEPSSRAVPVSLCSSSIPVPSTPEPSSSIIPVSLCNSILGSSSPECPGNTVPVSPCTSIPVPSILESPGSPMCSLVLGPCTVESPGSTTPGLPNNISSVSCNPNSPGSSALPLCSSGSPGNASTASCTSTTSVPTAVTGTSMTPVPTAVTGTSMTPVSTVVAGTSPMPTVVAGTSMTPVPTVVAGTCTSPMPTVVVGTCTSPVPTAVVSTSMTPVSTVVAGTCISPVPTAVAGTCTSPVPTVVTGTCTSPVPTAVTGICMTPVPTAIVGTSMTPVPTVVVGTSPVPTAVIGTCTSPVPTAVVSTSMTPVPTAVTGTCTSPVPTAVVGTSMTPVPTAVAGTSMSPVLSMATSTFRTPQGVGERSSNTPKGSLPCARDSAVETDSLLWHCPREQLKTLPRAQLEERLERALIIIEALLLQLCDLKDSQQLRPGMGPAKQRDTFTQTDTTHPTGSTWNSQSLLFRGLAAAAFQSLQDEQGALMQECQAVLETAPSKVQSCLEEPDAIRQRVDEALRAQDQGYLFLEAFCAHARAQISARDQSLASQEELSTLLAHAINLQASLSAKAQSFREFLDVTFENLKKERKAVDEEREQTRALISRSFALLEREHGKLQSCLEERAAAQKREEEALQAKEEASRQLEKTLVTLQDTQAQLEKLTVANSLLGKDLSSMGINLSSVEQERDALQQENEKQQEEMAQLAQERNSLQQERKELCQELREAAECREFLDQENQMCRKQLLEVEARLNSTLATLQERIQQHEELMESHQLLREEQAALSKELDSTKAELFSLQINRSKISCCSTGITKNKMRLQELADCLKAALEEPDDDDSPPRSKAWTPRLAWTPACRTPHHTSFVGSVMKAVSGEDANETTRSGSRVAKDKLASVPKPIDPEDTLLESVKELGVVVSNFATLGFRIQELKTEISDLQLRLKTVTAESQEKVDDQAATIAELHKALRTKLENEKELRNLLKKQEEQMLQLIDKSGEVTRLKTEVSELKRSLQLAETEAKVLWEEVKGKEHQEKPVNIQERVLLRQQVDKLRMLFVKQEDEKRRLTDKYLEQIRGLEMKFHQTQKVLRTHEEMQENIKELLSAVPEVALSCQELQNLLRYVGLKPATKEAAEPL